MCGEVFVCAFGLAAGRSLFVEMIRLECLVRLNSCCLSYVLSVICRALGDDWSRAHRLYREYVSRSDSTLRLTFAMASIVDEIVVCTEQLGKKAS